MIDKSDEIIFGVGDPDNVGIPFLDLLTPLWTLEFSKKNIKIGEEIIKLADIQYVQKMPFFEFEIQLKNQKSRLIRLNSFSNKSILNEFKIRGVKVQK